MKDASDNESVAASISAETSNAPAITTEIQNVTAAPTAPTVTIPIVTVTATQSTDEPALRTTRGKAASKTGNKK